MAGRSRSLRLPPEVNRILYVRNLPFKITSEEVYDLFGRYGALRQVRLGDAPETKGSAFVVYEDVFDAKNACEHLSGFNVGGRYLVCLYYKPAHSTKAVTLAQQQEEVLIMRARVAAGEAAAAAAAAATAAAAAAAAAGGGDADVSLDDEADRRMMRR